MERLGHSPSHDAGKGSSEFEGWKMAKAFGTATFWVLADLQILNFSGTLEGCFVDQREERGDRRVRTLAGLSVAVNCPLI